METFLLVVLLSLIIVFLWYRNNGRKERDRKLLDKLIEEKKHTYDRKLPLKNCDGKIFQIIETVGIIERTSNIDTALTRLGFLKNVLQDLDIASTSRDWSIKVDEAVKRYEEKYFKKVMHQQRQIANYPRSILKQWNSYYDEKLFNSFRRFTDVQIAKGAKLKTEKAKARNKEDILVQLAAVKNEIQSQDYQLKLQQLEHSFPFKYPSITYHL